MKLPTFVEAKAIVVGSDFSPGARAAVSRAMQIASSVYATLHVVHVQPRLPPSLQRRVRGLDGARTRHALERLVAEVRRAGVDARGRHLVGKVPEVLAKTARDVHADLVVVGSRGRAVRDAVVGSTAERVLASAHVPVLLARQSRVRPYRKAILAVDRSSDVRAATTAAQVACAGCPVEILHVADAPYEATLLLQGARPADVARYRRDVVAEAAAAIRPRVAAAGLDVKALSVVPGPAASMLVAQPSNVLLVMNRRGSLLRRVVLGSVTRWVIARGEADVLLV